jgi:formylglycine-generating enzyme required for sulfatase activity
VNWNPAHLHTKKAECGSIPDRLFDLSAGCLFDGAVKAKAHESTEVQGHEPARNYRRCGGRDLAAAGKQRSCDPPKFSDQTASGMTMVLIPGGEFTMGVDEGPIDVKPAHQVKVDGFLMDQQEMTRRSTRRSLVRTLRAARIKNQWSSHVVGGGEVLQRPVRP